MDIPAAIRARRPDMSTSIIVSAAVVVIAGASIAWWSGGSSPDVAERPVPERASRSAGSAPGSTPVSNGRGDNPLVLVSGAPMFPLPGAGPYSRWIDAPVMAQDVAVGSVTSRGFWMGAGDTQRMFVTIPPGAIEKGSLDSSELEVGSLVNVSGYVRAVADDLRGLGLDEPGRVRLDRAGVLLEANSVRPARPGPG